MNTLVPLKNPYRNRNRTARDPQRPLLLPSPTPDMREANVTSLVRACLATARAAARGGTITAADVGHDRDAFALATKAASSPTMLSANLQSLVVDFVTALALGPASAGAALLGQGLQLSFSYGGILVPGFVADADNVRFVGETEPIPINELTAGAILLEPRKLATIVVLTNEMISSSNAEALVRDCLTRAAALALDRAMLDANPADAARPAGLRHGISALTASTASDPQTAMIADLTALAAAVAPVSGNTPITVIADAARAMTIRLCAHELPFTILTSAATGNDVIALAPPALVSATGGVDIDASRESATLHMEGATPQPIGDGGTFAVPVRSMFQTDCTGLKLRMIANWALRDARALAWLTPTNW